MKHKQISILLATSLLALTSCGRQAWDGGLVSVEYDKLPKGEDITLSDWVGEPEFIALDSSPEAYIDGHNISISEHYIGVYSNLERPFKLFDRATGKYLRDIGNIGRGPGEYTGISFAQIDEAGGKVWVSTLSTNNIYSYDISTGRLSDDLPLAYGGNGNPNQGYNFMVNGKARTVTVASAQYESSCPAAWCQDFQGNVIWEIPKTGTGPENPMFRLQTSLNVKDALDICQWSMNTQQDTLYIIQDKTLLPVLTMKLGKTTQPGVLSLDDGSYMHTPFILPDYAVVNISRIETVMSAGASVSIESSTQPSIVLDRRTGEVSRRNFTDDIMAGDECSPSFRNGYFVNFYSAESFLEAGPEALERGNLSSSARSRITAILENISEEDNDVILLAPLK